MKTLIGMLLAALVAIGFVPAPAQAQAQDCGIAPVGRKIYYYCESNAWDNEGTTYGAPCLIDDTTVGGFRARPKCWGDVGNVVASAYDQNGMELDYTYDPTRVEFVGLKRQWVEFRLDNYGWISSENGVENVEIRVTTMSFRGGGVSHLKLLVPWQARPIPKKG